MKLGFATICSHVLLHFVVYLQKILIMLVKTYGYAVQGITATKVIVEVNIGQGVNFFIVGLPDSAVKESQQRLYAALRNNNFSIPGKQITVNMAPADIRKEGSAYDLTIAIG